MTEDLLVQRIEQQDPRLGRQLVHDPRSRNFPRAVTVDRTTWRDKRVRIYDPHPNPNQPVGCCTGVDKCVAFNAVGDRTLGRVLDMNDALDVYSLATTLDPWPGAYPPDDTGSSGLAAAKAAQQLGIGGKYRWIFGGADEVVQTVIDGDCAEVGSWWYWDMFNLDGDGRVHVSGGRAGGHQWTARGYWKSRDWIMGRCWWGGFRDFWITRADLDALLADDGDAHVQDKVAR